MYNYNENINIPKPIGNPDILNINETDYVSRQLYEKRGTQFYDVILFKNGQQYNLGRFNKGFDIINISYNKSNNKLLLYYSEFSEEERKMVIKDVIGLYDINDDMFLVLTKKEAVNIFDPNADIKYIKNKDELVIKNDINKRKKIR